MADVDRLEEIKVRLATSKHILRVVHGQNDDWQQVPADFNWLVAEVERLRTELVGGKHLCSQCGERFTERARCSACLVAEVERLRFELHSRQLIERAQRNCRQHDWCYEPGWRTCRACSRRESA